MAGDSSAAAAAVTSSTQPTLPLPQHALSLQYLRLRLIAAIIQVPLRIVLTFAYYFRDPSYLKKYQVTRSKILVPSRQRGRFIKVYAFRPKGTQNEGRKPLPVHINWHGSGFVLPCLGADTEICSYFASKLGCIVLDADYRKAPQNPFPAGVQDAEDVCLYVMAHPELYDTSNITIGGSSAGACISLAVGAKLGPEKIRAVASIAPPTDFRPSSRPKKAPLAGHRAALPPWVSLFFDSCYLVLNSDRNNPLLSPICADPKSFPRSVYIATGTGDTLYKDGVGVIDKLKAANHPNATFRSVEGAGHAFEKFRTDEPGNWATIVLEDIVNVIRGSRTTNTQQSPKINGSSSNSNGRRHINGGSKM